MDVEFAKRPVFNLADGTTVEATGVTVHGTGISGRIVSITVEGVTYPFQDRPSALQDANILDVQPEDVVTVLLGYGKSTKAMFQNLCRCLFV